VRAAWRQVLQFAERDCSALAEACRDPSEQQHRLLLEILHANRATKFGTEHDFGGVRSIDEFRRAVPVRSYAEFEPWITRVAEGETNVLTSDDVVAFEETSGTSSGRKLIPYTAASLTAFRAAVLPWLARLVRRRPGIVNGRAYVAASPVNRAPRVLPCGLPVGLPSEGAYLGGEIAGALGQLMALPPISATQMEAPMRIDAWRERTLAELAKCRDLTFISIWSPTFLLELVDGLPADAWPQLDTISMWTDGASAPYARRVAELFPHAHIDAKGLLATESAVTVRVDDEPGCIPALTSAVIEFADATGACLLSHELAAGASYRAVITTPGGLYRYDTGDEVRCIGTTGGVPRLQFVGRAGLVSDLVGEKLTEGFVSAAMGVCGRPASLVPCDAPNPHYEIWLDAPDSGDGDAVACLVDDSLRRNVQYAYARDLGQLRPPVTVFREGFAAHRRHTLVERGHRLGDVKLSALILDRTTLP
jgi:hypothetical protein